MWEHTRLAGDVLITTAGVAKVNHQLNLDGNEVEISISVNDGMSVLSASLIWGTGSVDVSLLPALMQIPPAYIHFEEGEDIQTTFSVRGQFYYVDGQFTNFSDSENVYGGEDLRDKEGVEVAAEVRKDEETGQNKTVATLKVTDTQLKSTHGLYSAWMHTSDAYVLSRAFVLPKGVMSPVPEGKIVFKTYVHSPVIFGGPTADVYGMSRDEQTLIWCYAIGYSVDDVAIIGPSLETSYKESTTVQVDNHAVFISCT